MANPLLLRAGAWIGVDLDGTLAHDDHGLDIWHIGPPIVPMMNRVIRWLEQGYEVRIVTARVGFDPQEPTNTANAEFAADQTRLIESWCMRVFGQRLRVTANKDFNMLELWDDRCVQVRSNYGTPVGDLNRMGIPR